MKIKLEEQSVQEVEGFSYSISCFIFFLAQFIVQPNCVYTYKMAFLKDFQLPPATLFPISLFAYTAKLLNEVVYTC